MRSITLRLVLAFVAVSVLSTLLVVGFTRWRSREEFRTFLIDQNRPALILALSDYYHQHGSWDGIQESHLLPQQAPPAQPQLQRGVFTLVDSATGRVVLAGQGYQAGSMVPAAELPRGIPIQSGSKTVGVLFVNQPVYRIGAPGSAFLDRINLQTLWGGLLAIGLALILAIILSSTLTRPVRELTIATRAVASGSPAQQVPIRSKDELGQLASSFNRMSSDLARSLELRRQMTADIAHELRTPISIILGHAEAVHDGVLPASSENFEIVRQEAERLEHLVEDLRTLSMADAGELKLVMQPYDPRELLERSAKVYAHQAGQKDIAIDVHTDADLPLMEVDAQRMVEVLANSLDNAIRYTPEGGHIGMSATRSDGMVEIRVQDSGPGVEPGELDKIFERFYRTESSRSRDNGGSGLGFAIARSIVERHNGRIWAESQPGRGLTVVMRLPVMQPGANTGT